MFVSKMIQITLGTRCEAIWVSEEKKKTHLHVYGCLYFFMHQRRETSMWVNLCAVSQKGKAEQNIIRVRNRERNKEKVSKGVHEHTHTPSPPTGFLPGVFVNHPFRSVSLWVGPLPFNAGTFVARDSAAIQILCRHLTPQYISHKPHLTEEH